MDPKELSANLWTELLGHAEMVNDSNDCRISRRMGRSEDFLAKLKQRRRGVSLEDFLRLGRATGLPEWELVRRLFPEPEGPAAALRQLRAFRLELEAAVAALPPPLDGLEEARASLEKKRRGAAPPGRSRVQARLAFLDELRREDPAAGCRLLEREIATQLLQLQCAKAVDPAAAAALAVAIALWSDQQRLAGRLDLAAEACPRALDFAELAGDRWALAHGLKAAALLALEHGAPACAALWLERAGYCFGLANDPAQLAQVLALEGQVLLGLGRHRAAAAALRDALERLPESEPRARRPLLLALAEAAQALGHPAEALASLENLDDTAAAAGGTQLEILWRKAAAQLALNEHAAARELVGQATRLTFRDGRALDAGYAVLEIARYLLEKGKTASLAALAGQVVANLGSRSKYRGLTTALEDFYALSMLRPLQKKDLEALEKRLKTLGPPPPRSLFLRAA